MLPVEPYRKEVKSPRIFARKGIELPNQQWAMAHIQGMVGILGYIQRVWGLVFLKIKNSGSISLS